VPPEWSARWKGKFDQGWDKLREETLARQIQTGVVPAGTKLAPKPSAIKDWTSLTPDEKRLFTRQAEVFAGFLEMTDHEIGRVVEAVEAVGGLDNTLVFYIVGDNGTSAEGGMNGLFNEYTYFNGVHEQVPDLLKVLDKWGSPETYPHMAAGWAVALDAPFTWTKQVASNFGGTRNGMVVHWPKGIKAKGEIRSQFHHVIDVAPTILEAAQLPEPKVVNGTPQIPMEGVSLAYTFDDAKAKDRHVTQYFEMFGNRAIYHDGWLAGTIHKAPWEAQPRHPLTEDVWELFDVRADWSLANDLAAKNPAKLAELQALFLKEASVHHVLPIRAARHHARAHFPDARRGHDRHARERVPEREEQVEDDHGGGRGPAGRRERSDPGAGRALRRLGALRQGRPARLRLQLPRNAAHEHRRPAAAACGQGDDPARLRLRRRRHGQGRHRHAVGERPEGGGGPHREDAAADLLRGRDRRRRDRPRHAGGRDDRVGGEIAVLGADPEGHDRGQGREREGRRRGEGSADGSGPPDGVSAPKIGGSWPRCW
jgi:hypothetical protein